MSHQTGTDAGLTVAAGRLNSGPELNRHLPTMPDPPNDNPKGGQHLPTMPDPLNDPERGQQLPTEPDPTKKPAQINDPLPRGNENEDVEQIA
jgi:hypothetical protein